MTQENNSSQQSCLVLNGPIGTQLISRGFAPHPVLWTARAAFDARTMLREIYADYLSAGANIVTANTFAASPYRAAKAGMSPDEARKLVHTSVAVATDAVEDARGHLARFVAGSMGPAEDCYQPSLVPSDAELEKSHGLLARWLSETSCDLILVQTMNTKREALTAVRAARSAGMETVFVSFITDDSGTKLLSGESLLDAARACVELGAQGITVNCMHLDATDRALATLAPLRSQTIGEGENKQNILLGAYANASKMSFNAGGQPEWAEDARPEEARATEYADRAMKWVTHYGAQLIGSCCGTSPHYTRKIVQRLNQL